MDIILIPLIQIIITIISLYNIIIIADVIFDWLKALGILDMRNRYALKIGYVLNRLTDPVLSHVRRKIKPIGGIDISPFIVILILVFLEEVLTRLAYKLT